MTKRQFRVLYRDALRRIVDVELLSVHARGDAGILIGQFLSLLIFLSLLFSVPAIYFSGKLSLALAFGVTLAAYTACYLRSLRKIVEQADIMPRPRRQARLPRFGDSFVTAVVQFSIRTLLRSRQHRMILAFYLGIVFGATVFLLKSPIARQISRPPLVDPGTR